MNTEQQIKEREQLESRIKSNEKKHRDLLLEQGQLRFNRREAENAYNGYASQYERQKSEHSKHQANRAKEELNAICKRMEAIDIEIDWLSDAIDNDKNKRESIKISVTGQQLIEQQDAVKQDLQKVDSIQTMIVEKEHIIATASNKIDTTGQLRKRRGLLLAEATTGADNSQKISTLDAEIAKAEQTDRAQNTANAAAAAKAQETIDGFREMLATLNKQIGDKQRVLAYMRDYVLGQIVQQEAEKYKAAAEQLAESIKMISVIETLINQAGIRVESGILNNFSRSLIKIPPLSNMESSKSHGADFLNMNPGNMPTQEVKAFVLAALAEKGIEV